MLGRELDVAMELIGEVFSVGEDEVKRMVKERMEKRGMIRERRMDLRESAPQEMKMAAMSAAGRAKRSSKLSKKREKSSSSTPASSDKA
jgi:hypothetical protein